MKNFLLIIFTMSWLNLFGQDISCFNDIVKNKYYSQYELVKDVAIFEKKFPKYNIEKELKFDVQIIVVSRNPLKQVDSVSQSVKSALNKAFESSSIRFNVKKNVFQLFNDSLDVDYFYDNYDKQIESDCYHKNFINLYLFSKSGSSFIGLSQYPFTNYNRIMLNIDNLKDGTLEHEFGHYFGLLHTFENTLFVKESDAEMEGDYVCDTSTDLREIAFSESDCETFGEFKDLLGNIFCPPFENYMSYYGKCRKEFSKVQIRRMNLFAYYRKLKS